ncbi:MAG: SpoVA/SpoVAEb family sporulation membrane protein [Bacillota bacterium]|jgi:stage V sporulation protein AE
MLLQLLPAFLIGGIICLIGQIMFDIFKLTPAHTMCILVVSGAVLGGLGLFQKLVDFAGMGAGLTIASFGNTLVKGAMQGMEDLGFWGIFQGLLSEASPGIAAAVVFSFIASFFFRPKQ